MCHYKFLKVKRWFSASLKYFVLISLQVGACINRPDWVELKSKRI